MCAFKKQHQCCKAQAHSGAERWAKSRTVRSKLFATVVWMYYRRQPPRQSSSREFRKLIFDLCRCCFPTNQMPNALDVCKLAAGYDNLCRTQLCMRRCVEYTLGSPCVYAGGFHAQPARAPRHLPCVHQND